jgi:uncharacterized protein YndB with AHSA1/START domain
MVQAPAERVWHLLTTPAELQRWSGLKIVKGPDRPLTAGDQIAFRGGLIRLRVMDLEPLRRLELEVHFPFGIVNHEVFVITPGSDGTCRVTYN